MVCPPWNGMGEDKDKTQTWVASFSPLSSILPFPPWPLPIHFIILLSTQGRRSPSSSSSSTTPPYFSLPPSILPLSCSLCCSSLIMGARLLLFSPECPSLWNNVVTAWTSSHANFCPSYLSAHGSWPCRSSIVAANGFRSRSVVVNVCSKSSSAGASSFASLPSTSSSAPHARRRKKNSHCRSFSVPALEEGIHSLTRRLEQWTTSRVCTRNENAQRHSFDVSALDEVMNGAKCTWSHRLVDFPSNYGLRVSATLRKGLMVSIVVTILLTSPSVTFSNGSLCITENIAVAQPIRQLALFLERLAGGSTSTKVLDRLVTVISGQTVVTPETLEQLKSVIDGEKDITELQTDIANSAEDFWKSVVDTVLHFDPLSLIDTAGTGIQGFFEIAAERFAAFELSTLVALGERWLLWVPFVMLPMYWQMSRNKENDDDIDARSKAGDKIEVSEDVRAKAMRVREELERIELKSSLFDMVSSLGKMAWQTSGGGQNQTRKEIDKVLARLQELNPGIEDMSALPSIPDIDGDWMLMYVSQVPDESQPGQLPPLPSLDVLGVELSDVRQKVWQKQTRAVTSEEEIGKLMMARNTAKIRLGPLGVVELSVEGPWENLTNGKGAFVSFETIYARPVEVFGSHVREDLPPVGVSIPRTLQTGGEWQTVYLDNTMRISKGSRGQMYLFRRGQ